MEKLKWIILGILLIILLVVIFRTPDISEQPVEGNHALVKVKHSDFVQSSTNLSQLITQGEYILYPDELQFISGKGMGWHLSFSRPFEKKDMIMIVDIVDTSGILQKPLFPITLYHDPMSNILPDGQKPLYRAFISVGYKTQTGKNRYQEDLIPFTNLKLIIDTTWSNDLQGGLIMHFQATHSNFLRDVYGFRYNISGRVQIDSANFTHRILQ